MEFILSFAVFLFGIITWIPFLKGVYGQDVAGVMYWVDRCKKGELILYKDGGNLSIGHYSLIFFMQKFWNKYNTKAFYWIMSIYSAITAFVLFWILSNLFGLLSAFIGCMLFSLYIVSPRLDGNWGPFEQLIPLPLFGSILCMLISSNNNSYTLILLSGMLLGYAILIKQVAALYLPGFFIMVAGTGHSFFHLLIFLSGIIITNSVPPLYFWLRHDAFWEYLVSIWLFQLPAAINPGKYSKFYPQSLVRGQKTEIKKQVFFNNSRSLPPLLFLSAIGLITLFSYHFTFLYLGLLLCLLSSVLTVFMRGTFFAHYWLNMVPWLAILASFGLSEVIRSTIGSGPPSAVTLAGILAVILFFLDAIRVDKKYYVLSKDPYQFLRKVWGGSFVNKYKQMAQIGEYIKNTTKKDEKILICGVTPHILFYSDRTHFTKSTCYYAKDYLDIYNRNNPSSLDFLNSIYKFRNFKIVKQRENEFHKGYPEIIVFAEGEPNTEGFEKLTGLKYSLDEDAGGYPLFRADLELTELMSFYDDKKSRSQDKPSYPLSEKDEVARMIESKNFTNAISIIKNALKSEPFNCDNLLLLGDCLIETGKHHFLFNFFKRLIEQGFVPDNFKPQLLNKVGESYSHQNKLNNAEETFRYVLSFEPNNTTALNNLGVTLFNKNRPEEAEKYFQKVLKIDPGNEDSLANLSALA